MSQLSSCHPYLSSTSDTELKKKGGSYHSATQGLHLPQLLGLDWWTAGSDFHSSQLITLCLR